MNIVDGNKSFSVNINMHLLFLCLLILCFNKLSYSDTIPTRIYETKKLISSPPVIDGLLDDEIWNTLEWSGDFVQREPYEGEQPTQQTLFKIIYDDNNLYVAIKAQDTETDKIEKRLTRRDEFDGDWVGIVIDSYNDKLTAFAFIVNAAGVKNDGFISNEDNMDETWDPVWYVKTSMVESGWNAEMKIPYTQLRFADKEEYIWGLQVMRWIFRKEEFSAWQHVPMETSRWVSMFGELQGIKGIKPKKEVEIIPYVMGNTERFEEEEGNPYATGSKYGYSAGVDGKIAVTNNMTLNFTVNPDFGQVEADPSEVNLTAFETYFPEKRPFFIEGSNIYNFSLTDGDGPMSQDNLFYSRRIGRTPHHEPELIDDSLQTEYSDQPEFTTILGAFKLSGKTQNGWSIGVMESLAAKEFAKIDAEGEERKEMVEPLTNYFNTRIQKDLKEGNTTIGGMVTATNRKIDSESIDFLHHSAYTGGLDFTNYWKEKSYYFQAIASFSHMVGNTKSITELQESSRRYYQRPDANHLTLDTTLTSLTGHGGTIGGGKIGAGHWRYVGWITWRSPGLELNDMGYLRQADVIQQVLWAQYRIWEPFSIFRSLNVNFNQWSGYDFSGTRVYLGGNVNFHMQFKNYWSFGSGINRDGAHISRSELRGGPALRFPGDWNNWVAISTDERKKLNFELFMFNNWGDENNSRFFDVGLEITYRPLNVLSLSIEPGYRQGRRDLQYVETIELDNDNRYIISTLNSEMFSADFRINFSLTPDLSIQYWGQPYIFAGNYSTFKRITNPMNDDYNNRFHIYEEGVEIFYDEENEIYEVDENQDGDIDYNFENPNFNFFEFRSNLVARWEYIPGSSIYFVWSQGRTGDNSMGEFDFVEDMENLFSIVPHNVFLIKFSYRFSL